MECRYKKVTTFPETVSIRVRVESVQSVRLRLNYHMTNEAGKTVCEAASEHCSIGRDGRILRIETELPELYRLLSELEKSVNLKTGKPIDLP